MDSFCGNKRRFNFIGTPDTMLLHPDLGISLKSQKLNIFPASLSKQLQQKSHSSMFAMHKTEIASYVTNRCMTYTNLDGLTTSVLRQPRWSLLNPT